MSLLSCIKRPKMKMFRRLYFRRRLTSGEYETDWQRIPNKYIKKWGTVSYSVEEEKPNFFKYSGMTISVVNNDGYFSDEGQSASFFYGYLGIHRTLVKVEAGYIDTDDTEYPASSTLFIGLIDIGGTKYKTDNEVSFKVNHLSQIFEEFPADTVKSIGSTQTASQLIGRIRDHTDNNSVAVFQKYISSGAWNVTATTKSYNLATATSVQGLTCWSFMQKLAEAENYVIYMDNNANFYFKENSGVPASVTFHFSGINDSDRTWGHTIMRDFNIDPGYDKIYNRIKVKFDTEETTTSYAIYQESWNWGDSSSSFRFGVREYSTENNLMSQSVASATSLSLFTEFSEPKNRIQFDSKFVPQVMLMNRVSVTYQSNRVIDGDKWYQFYWNSGIWGRTLAYNIDIDNEEFKVV